MKTGKTCTLKTARRCRKERKTRANRTASVFTRGQACCNYEVHGPQSELWIWSDQKPNDVLCRQREIHPKFVESQRSPNSQSGPRTGERGCRKPGSRLQNPARSHSTRSREAPAPRHADRGHRAQATQWGKRERPSR